MKDLGTALAIHKCYYFGPNTFLMVFCQLQWVIIGMSLVLCVLVSPFVKQGCSHLPTVLGCYRAELLI